MKNATPQVLFIGNHAKKTLADIPQETLQDFNVNTITFQRGSVLQKSSSKLIFNDTICDFNGDYEIENLSIGLTFSLEEFINKSNHLIIIGDPFELLFQSSIYACLKENPNDVKNKNNFNEFKDLTVVLLYPATLEFENLRKEISQLIYILKKHKVNTFLIENQINQPSAIDNILYYFDPNEINQLEHKIKGIKQILGHVTMA